MTIRTPIQPFAGNVTCVVASLSIAFALASCSGGPDDADRVFGTQEQRGNEQQQLNNISVQDDDMNADAGITNDGQMEPLNP